MGRRWLAVFQELGRAAVTVVAPPRCIWCLAPDGWLCRGCAEQWGALPRPELVCPVCERPRPRGLTCQRCRNETWLTGAVSALPFGAPAVRRAVHWLKFRGVAPLAPLLAPALTGVLPVVAPVPVLQRHGALVPVPLHRRRQRTRGYNQSERLAAAVAALTGIPLCDVLQRTSATAPQTHLPPDLRARNVAGAFTVRAGARLPSYVLLIDDVLTTGATLQAAAAAIRQPSDAREVWGVTVAR